MKILARVSVLVAGALLMFHTFVSHQHHSELNPKEHIGQHQSADSLFDFIKLALHLDQGEGHLEDYQIADQQLTLAAVDLEVATFIINPIAEEPLRISFSVTQEALPLHYLISNLRFRGPPV
jgi:hypothetical protein